MIQKVAKDVVSILAFKKIPSESKENNCSKFQKVTLLFKEEAAIITLMPDHTGVRMIDQSP